MRRFAIPAALLAMLLACSSGAQTPQPPASPGKAPAGRDARMKWWREARFGMFVHWGLYSGLAGTWNGKPVGKKGGMEWIQQRVKADTDTYAKAAIPLFKPTKDFAREWARLAKEAGCRYLVFTTKHHDGFALHDSKVSDYDAGSVLGRDLVREIVDAARAEGLRVGFYHSVIDWHHDQYAYGKSRQLPHPLKGKPYPNGERDHAKYVDYLHAEVDELVSNYGPVDVMWWDYSAQDFQGDAAWRAFALMDKVRAKQPGIVMNNRLFRIKEAGWTGMGTSAVARALDPKYGDFITPEQHIPATGMPGIDWETCMTMNTTWGYSDHDHAWKSDEKLIRNLVDIASKGGNYLLNIGPKGDGRVPEPSVRSLRAIGAWMKVNNEAIYATQASPVDKPAWGRCTQKRLPDGNTRLYLHVFDWPADGKLTLAGLANKPLKASLLAGGKALEAAAAGNAIAVSVPAKAPDPVASVVVVDIQGAPQAAQAAAPAPAAAAEPAAPPVARETPQQRAARMKWWREARFGMFIHWGLYAVPAGHWNGKPVGGIGEWIMNNANIPVPEYEKFATQFNPVKFDAEEWVRIAKDAGMKYMVITSKHHDGFCLFDTKATGYDIVDATPYKKDLLRPLAAACRKQGLRFCTYYSIMDWHHPAQYRGSEKRYNPTKIHPERKAEYMTFMKAQLRELIEQTDTEVLWFDGEWPGWYTEEDGREIYNFLRGLKPSLIINNRVGKGRKGMEGMSKGDREYSGDFGTPEQQIPATGIPGVDWESCMTMNGTWGYKRDDHNWKSAETLIRNVIDIASKGGNYLLNVGPTAEGLIPGPSVERLKAVGAWMKVNGESIYATGASPFKRLAWGRCTRKGGGDTTTLYLHVFDWPADGALFLPGLQNAVTGAHLLVAPDRKLETAAAPEGVTVALPKEAPTPPASVVVLTIRGEPKVETPPLGQRADGSVRLAAADAALHGHQIKYETGHDRNNIGYWLDPKEWVSWTFQIDKPGTFAVTAEIAATGSGSFDLVVGTTKLRGKAPNTSDYGKFTKVELGTLEIGKGRATLEVRPVVEGWSPFNLKSLTLKLK